ncbi:BCAM0308 family protein [Methyloparacoccus murrellii]
MSTMPYRRAPQGHPIRLLPEWQHDPYHARRKWAEPTRCPDCGAVFRRGRWQGGLAPAEAAEHRCPACQRLADRNPAGYLGLRGAFLQAHRREIEHLVRNLTGREQTEHPLKQLMGVEETSEGGLEFTFTDPHLARSAGEAIQSAYAGELDYHYQDSEYLLRVRWQRDH